MFISFTQLCGLHTQTQVSLFIMLFYDDDIYARLILENGFFCQNYSKKLEYLGSMDA